MFQKYTVLIILMIAFLCDCASNMDVAENYIHYYQYINEAESNVLASDFYNATHNYKKAFSSVSNPFAIDYFNAILSSSYIKEINNVYEWSTKLAQKGCPISFFNQKAFVFLRGHSKKWQQFQDNYARNHSIYKQKIDIELQKQINILKALDQSYYTLPNRNEHLADIDSINKKIQTQFSEILQEKGFPSEHKIGVQLKNDTLISPPNYYILLIHQYQAGNFEWNQLLQESVLKGEIRPEEFISFYDYYNNNTFGKLIFWEIENQFYENRHENTTAINRKRKEIGMEDLNKYKEKVIFQYIENPNTLFNFGLNWAINVTPRPPDVILNEMLKKGFWIEYCTIR